MYVHTNKTTSKICNMSSGLYIRVQEHSSKKKCILYGLQDPVPDNPPFHYVWKQSCKRNYFDFKLRQSDSKISDYQP